MTYQMAKDILLAIYPHLDPHLSNVLIPWMCDHIPFDNHWSKHLESISHNDPENGRN